MSEDKTSLLDRNGAIALQRAKRSRQSQLKNLQRLYNPIPQTGPNL